MKVLSIFLAWCWLTPVNAQTLHFIIASDTHHPNAETAASCRVDSANMHKEAYYMGRGSGYSLQFYFITGANFNAANLRTSINAVPAKPGDVVWCFIAGNAICNKNEPDTVQKKNRWLEPGSSPQIKVSTDELLAVIEKKNARLNVLIVNACSLVRDIAAREGKKGDGEPKVYNSLLSACGTVRLFSSRCTELSYGSAAGGLFTNVLLDTLDHYISTGRDKMTWKELENDVCPTTNQRGMKMIFRPQHPQFFYSNKFKENCGP